MRIADDLFSGMLSGEFFVITAMGTLARIEAMVAGFLWPRRANLIDFLKGHSPDMSDNIEYYEA